MPESFQERMQDWVLANYDYLIGWGRLQVMLGGGLIVAGMLGHLATVSSTVLQQITRHALPEKALADLYPDLPTWWIPESLFGYLIAIVIMVSGALLSIEGHRIKRYWNERP